MFPWVKNVTLGFIIYLFILIKRMKRILDICWDEKRKLESCEFIELFVDHITVWNLILKNKEIETYFTNS